MTCHVTDLFPLSKFPNPTMPAGSSEADHKTPLLNQHHHHYNTSSGDSKPPVSRPKYKRRRSSFDASTYNSAGQSPGYVKSAASSIHEQQTASSDPGLNLLQILGLTVCMAGVQFTCKQSLVQLMKCKRRDRSHHV